MDLNPIRAALAETLEDSDFTPVQRRVRSLVVEVDVATESPTSNSSAIAVIAPAESHSRPDSCLSPVSIDELLDALGPQPSASQHRCSDKGFASMTSADYLQLLDWTARQIVGGKRGSTPADAPPIFARLRIKPEVWCQLIANFGILFSLVAGQPHHVDQFRSRRRRSRFHLRASTRELLTA